MKPEVFSGVGAETPTPIVENNRVTADQIRRYCEWVRDRLLVRTDAYITYDLDGRPYSPIDLTSGNLSKLRLTPDDVLRHALGIQPIAFYGIGQPGTAQENKCKWIAWDVDNHDGDHETRVRNTDYVLELATLLKTRLGFNPLVESSDGRGGFHIWTTFDDFVSSQVSFACANWVVEKLCDWRGYLTSPPECFPKHDCLTQTRRYSAALRAPGKHPRHDNVWSSILGADGSKWLPWPDAINEIVSHRGEPIENFPDEAQSFAPERRRTYSQPDRQLMEELYGPPLAVADPTSPAEFFNQNEDWESVLEPHGWEMASTAGDIKYWRRPGKYDDGHSASTGYCGDKLFVFSSNVEHFEVGRSYSKFQAFAILKHGGDYQAAEADILNSVFNQEEEK